MQGLEFPDGSFRMPVPTAGILGTLQSIRQHAPLDDVETYPGMKILTKAVCLWFWANVEWLA